MAAAAASKQPTGQRQSIHTGPRAEGWILRRPGNPDLRLLFQHSVRRNLHIEVVLQCLGDQSLQNRICKNGVPLPSAQRRALSGSSRPAITRWRIHNRTLVVRTNGASAC